MVINWYGQSCFRIQSGELNILIDPFSKEIGLVPPRFKTDLILISHDHIDHNNIFEEEDIFVITNAGEYEYKGVDIKGFESYHDEVGGKKYGKITIFLLVIENIRLLFLSDIGVDTLDKKIMEEIGNVDIVFVPVGGGTTVNFNGASRLVNQIEPKIVVPMHYKIPRLNYRIDGKKIELDDTSKFLKEFGVSKTNVLEKLTIKKKDIEQMKADELNIVVLKV